MNSNKSALIEALGRKGCAMSQYYLIYNEQKCDKNDVADVTITREEIDAVWLNLVKYVSTQDVKVCLTRYVLPFLPSPRRLIA